MQNETNRKEKMVSIIMPVYNSEQYLADAIDSVLGQKYSSFELLLIDDGSSDNSGSICDVYQNKDSRIIVYHKKNGGVCSARNFGLSVAKGEYITFIDNDDYYDKDFLNTMMAYINSSEVDIVKCGRRNVTVDNNGCIINSKDAAWSRIETFNKESLLQSYYFLKMKGILSSVWNGIYRKRFLIDNSLYFNESYRHGNEDVNFNICCYMVCSSLVMVKEVLYTHFYRNSHSTSLKFHEDQITTRLDTILLEESYIKPLNNSEMYPLLVMGNIRTSFRLLTIAPKGIKRIEIIKLIDKALNTSRLKKYRIGKYRELSICEKIDLYLIRLRWYNIYFFLHNIGRR